MARVTLVRPPNVLPSSSVTAQVGVPSLALAYLSSSLKERGHDVTLVDAIGEGLDLWTRLPDKPLIVRGLPPERVLDRIGENPDFIGISCNFSNEWLLTRKLIASIREKYPRSVILLGGEHATACFAEILAELPYVRAIVMGEGERAVCGAIEAICKGTPLDAVAGLAFIDVLTGKPKTTTPEPLQDLDSLPGPDWDAGPTERYLDSGYAMAARDVRALPLLATRGCPYSCTFCSAPQMWKGGWRKRSPGSIAAEARELIAKFRLNHLEFYDLSAVIDPKWMEQLCAALKPLGITWNFPSGIRSEALNADLLKTMKESGCYKLTLALETSVPHLIDEIRKRVDPLHLLNAVRAASRQNILVKVNFIWGMPNQSRLDLLRDLWFLTRLAWAGLGDATCFAFVPYPGSALYRELNEAGKIPTSPREEFLAGNVYNNTARMRSWSNRISDPELRLACLGGMWVFYLLQFTFRPARLFSSLRRLAMRKPVTMLELALDGLRGRRVLDSRRV